MGLCGQRHFTVATPGNGPVSNVQEVGWALGPVWTGAEYLAPPPKFDPRTVQPVASRHTDCTVLAHQKECRCRMSQCSLLVPTPVLFVPDSF